MSPATSERLSRTLQEVVVLRRARGHELAGADEAGDGVRLVLAAAGFALQLLVCEAV